jgi:signal transduction histidine kinase
MEKEEGEFQKESCAAILEQVLELQSYRFEKEQVQVIKQYAEDIPEIPMRVNSMQQIFLNIITNALDALKESEKKEIHIDVSRKDEFVLVTIADSGIGIAPENLHKIFDPFFTTKPPGKGTGLGLCISQGIIDTHEGRITCESTPGQGATFDILLPVKRKKVTK